MADKQIEGLFVLIDHGNEKGFKHLTDELSKRNMPAVVLVGESVLNNYSELRTLPLHEGIEIGAQCGSGANCGNAWPTMTGDRARYFKLRKPHPTIGLFLVEKASNSS